MCESRVEIYVLMSLFFPLLFWSMAGLTRCQCLEVLVLHRIIKMPNSLKRDPNLSLEKKTKMLFFVFYLRCKGTNRWEFYSVSVTLSLKNEDFTFYRESEAWWLYIYIWKANKMLMLGETFFPRSRFFFLNVWTSIWDGSLVELNMTPEGAVCVSVARGWGGETPHGVAMVIIGFPIKVASSFIDYLPLP